MQQKSWRNMQSKHRKILQNKDTYQKQHRKTEKYRRHPKKKNKEAYETKRQK